MRITAISDIHGSLIDIEETDLLIIAGDWSPLEIQSTRPKMCDWLKKTFVPYLGSLPAEKIILVAGNHDFICDENFLNWDYMSYDLPVAPIYFDRDILNPLLRKYKLHNKIKYLDKSSTTYNGIRIYGCPNVEGCCGWAFGRAEYTMPYKDIPKCDILITHQPPRYNGLGSVMFNGVLHDFGSFLLMDAIIKRKPSLVFCGHIHDGDHTEQIYSYGDGNVTRLYNCSIKNDDYEIKHVSQKVIL